MYSLRTLTTLGATAALLALIPSGIDAQQDIEVPSLEQVKAMVATWPQTPKEAATTMIEKYGAPDGVTSEMLTWKDKGPWMRTIVYREPVQHNFPMPHEDVLEQVIHYRVPADKFDELAAYDGSVIVERTKGVISARCDKEGANFLALNLANDIVTGAKTVSEARAAYGAAIKAMMDGESPEYMSRLMFEVPKDGTADPDETTLKGGGKH